MNTMVCFEAGGSSYCVPLDATRAVRTTQGLVSLPDPSRDVAGIIPGDPPLTVIAPLECRGGHVLVMEVGEHRFGLLVDKVTGLRKVEEGEVRPAPSGQGRRFVSGTLDQHGLMVLVADPVALSERLS